MTREEAQEYTDSLGQIISGGWRQIEWAQRNGIPDALGLSLPEWVQQIGGYIKLQKSERQAAVLELKANGHSNRGIGDVLGVDEKTVRNDTAENSAPDSENSNGANGASHDTAENSAPLEDGCEEADFDEEEEDEAKKPPVRGTTGTGDNEWYTPENYIVAARAVDAGSRSICPSTTACARLVRKSTATYKGICGADHIEGAGRGEKSLDRVAR